MTLTINTLPPFGDPRISYGYSNDDSSPAEPNLRNDEGESVSEDAQVLRIDGKSVFTLEVPWGEEQGYPLPWTDRELYDAYKESLSH